MNKALNKLTKYLYVQYGAAVLFTLLSISFNFDISIFAFILAAVFTGLLTYFTFIKMIKNKDGKFILPVWKMNEYLPFVLFVSFIMRRAGKNGTAFWYDFITVILWTITFVLSFIISHHMNPKHSLEYCKDFSNKPDPNKKLHGMAKVGFETVDWIDALVQAIFTVCIFQIFFFQLYEIPSESMVPEFLIKDRVIVSKIDCGPKFPLTEIGLPDIRKYKRGDTIVLRNPHYTIDRKSEVRTVTSQLIYMLSIMTVNINKDENGELKADPLVKRICGEPGEQLVMQDGVLYARKNGTDFVPVQKDEQFAAWNLNTLNPKIKQKVQRIPLTSDEYNRMLQLEEERRSFDLTAAKFQAQELARKFNQLAYKDNLAGDFSKPSMFCYDLYTNVQDVTRQLMSQNGGTQWFENFMTSWIPKAEENKDLYAEANFKTNVMFKLAYGNLIVRYAELYRNNISASLWSTDTTLLENAEKAFSLIWYVQMVLDERNMPVFPSNDSNGNPQYIPENCYFMMGDNRFNSLDLRHSNDSYLAPVTDYDSTPIEYYSMMAPQYIHKKYIIGKPVYRFLPAGRIGKLK